MNIENLSQMTQFLADSQPHIVIDKEKCRNCGSRPCVTACPAKCYAWDEANKLLNVVYENCLECGTCYAVCGKNALDWTYPRGGFGVNYRLT
jgi:ferredoxin like protein